MSRATIVEVAKAANVSISSVSRYLANPQSINQISAVRIGKAIYDLNYIPNTFARNLKRGTTNIIGFIQPDITQSLFNRAAKALNEMFFQNDYLLITCDTDNNPEKELRHINTLIEQNVAGIIISPCAYQSEPTVSALSKCKNLVYLDRLICTDTDAVSSVLEDNYEKSCQLAEVMLHRSQKNHLVLTGTEYSYVTRERLGAFKDTLENHGILLNSTNVCPNLNDSDQSVELVIQYLKKGVDSILFTNPKILSSIISACKRLGLKINRDLVIGGFTYEYLYRQYSIEFPCIIQHPYDLGLAAGDLILKMIKKADFQPKQIVIPCELRV